MSRKRILFQVVQNCSDKKEVNKGKNGENDESGGKRRHKSNYYVISALCLENAMPKCAYAFSIATLPLGVRSINPNCMR